MHKIILVGGFGFIGKNIIEELYQNYEIIVIGRKKDILFMSKYPKVIFYEYEFLRDSNLNEIIKRISPDFIINLVSIVTASRNMNDFQTMIRLNTEVLLELYEASKDYRNLKLFLQFGSGEEYGNIRAPFKETDREYPSSPYALSKQLCTNTSVMLYNNYKFPISVVRPGNLFGKYQDTNKFIPYIVSKLSRDETIQTTVGEQKRDFIFAKDFAIGIDIVLKAYENFLGEIFNLSSGSSIELRAIVEFCKKNLNSSSLIEYGKLSYRENEMMEFELETSKFKKLANVDFEIEILDSLLRYMEMTGGKSE